MLLMSPTESETLNEYEIAARKKKAIAIAEFVLSHMQNALVPGICKALEAMTDEQWDATAAAAGQKHPSATTREWVVEFVRESA